MKDLCDWCGQEMKQNEPVIQKGDIICHEDCYNDWVDSEQ